MAPALNSYHVICAIMTLSTIIANYGRSFAFHAGRFAKNTNTCRPSGSLSSSILNVNQCRRTLSSASLLKVSTYDNEETIGTVPYSTSTSKQVKAKPATSSSTLPFSSPRNSFDDSLPSSYQGSNGVSEWAKLGLLTDLIDALTSTRIGLTEGPTPVQSMAIPEILRGCKERMASIEDVKKKREIGKSSFDVDVSGGPANEENEMVIPHVTSVAFAAATGKFLRDCSDCIPNLLMLIISPPLFTFRFWQNISLPTTHNSISPCPRTNDPFNN